MAKLDKVPNRKAGTENFVDADARGAVRHARFEGDEGQVGRERPDHIDRPLHGRNRDDAVHRDFLKMVESRPHRHAFKVSKRDQAGCVADLPCRFGDAEQGQ